MERNRSCDDNWFTRDESRKEREALLRCRRLIIYRQLLIDTEILSAVDSILIEAGQRCTN